MPTTTDRTVPELTTLRWLARGLFLRGGVVREPDGFG